MPRSDVICDFPLKEMLAEHKKNEAEGTILVTQVILIPFTQKLMLCHTCWIHVVKATDIRPCQQAWLSCMSA